MPTFGIQDDVVPVCLDAVLQAAVFDTLHGTHGRVVYAAHGALVGGDLKQRHVIPVGRQAEAAQLAHVRALKGDFTTEQVAAQGPVPDAEVTQQACPGIAFTGHLRAVGCA